MHKIKNNKKILAISSLVVVIGLITAVYVISRAHQPVPTQGKLTNVKTAPTIDYSPGTTQDNADTDKEKANGTIASNTPVTVPRNASTTITRAQQDTQTASVIVKASITGLTEGTCRVTFKKEATELTKQAAIIQKVNYYSCDGFNVPVTEFSSSGSWNITLEIFDSANSLAATTQSTVTVSR